MDEFGRWIHEYTHGGDEGGQPTGNLRRSLVVDRHRQDPCGAPDDLVQVGRLVELQARRQQISNPLVKARNKETSDAGVIHEQRNGSV